MILTYPRCTFKSVIEVVLAYAGQAGLQIDDTQTTQVAGFINLRLRDWAWTAYWWPQICPVELRRYRANYAAGTAYAGPTEAASSEVYFPATQQYYQAIRATTGNPPAMSISGRFAVNAAYWSIASGPYAAYTWATGKAYELGAIVKNETDQRSYQCFEAHLSGADFDPTKFGLLNDFVPTIAQDQSWEENRIGEFLGIYADNPNTSRQPRRLRYTLGAAGATVANLSRPWRGHPDQCVPHQIYVRFRTPPPEFRGAAYSALKVYLGGNDVVYFAGETTDLEGDFWACVTTTLAGESPATTPLKWLRRDFPLWLRSAVARRAFADWLRYGSQREAAGVEDSGAVDDLFQAQLLSGAGQGQNLNWRSNA